MSESQGRSATFHGQVNTVQTAIGTGSKIYTAKVSLWPLLCRRIFHAQGRDITDYSPVFKTEIVDGVLELKLADGVKIICICCMLKVHERYGIRLGSGIDVADRP